MADDKEIGKLSVSVALDGTGFQNGVSEINRKLAVVKSEFKAAAAQIGDFGNQTDALKLKSDSLSQQIELQKQKVSALSDVYSRSAETKGSDAKATQDLQIKLNKAREVLATMQNDLQKTTLDLEKQSSEWNELGNAVSTSSEKVKTGISSIGQIVKSSLIFGAVYEGLQKVKDGFESVIGGGIKFDSQIQQNQIAFTTMLGSAEKSKDLMSQIVNMAAATPFETSDLTKASQELLSFGITSDKIIPTLQMLGDVSQGNKERFDALTLAFAQITSAGKMQGGDLLQLVNAGFNPLQIISQKTGKSMAELRDEMAKGAISADMVTQAFQDATSKGGMFYNAMQNQSTTFAGLMSTLQDNLNTTFGTVMKPVFDWLTNVGLPKVIDMTNKFTSTLQSSGFADAFKTILPPSVVDGFISFGEKIKDIFEYLKNHTSVVIALVSAFVAFKTSIAIVDVINSFKKALEGVRMAQMALNLVMEINPFVAIATAVIGIGVLIYTHWDQVKKFLTETWNAISSTASSIWNSISNFFINMWNDLKIATTNIWNNILSFFQSIWSAITDVFRMAWNIIGPLVTSEFEAIKAVFSAYFTTIKTIVAAAWDIIKTIFATAFLVIYDIVTGNWGQIGNVFSAAGDKLHLIITGAWDKIKTAWGAAFDAIKNVATAELNLVKSIFTTAFNALEKVVQAGWNALTNIFKMAVTGAKNLIQDMWDGIVWLFTQAPGRLVQALEDLGVAMYEKLVQIKDQFIDMGKNMILGMIDGIKSMASYLAQQAIQVVQSAVNAAKGFLGIHSPSKVFMEIGAYTTQGFALGMTDNLKQVTSAANSLAKTAIPTIQSQKQNYGGVQILVTGNTISSPADEDRLVNKISQKIAGVYGLSVGGSF